MIQIKNEVGIPFNVRIVFLGDKYGRDDCLTHGERDGEVDRFAYDAGPMIEFYDARFASAVLWKRGQFVSRYYVETLTKSVNRGYGLCLDGGVPDWTLDAGALEIALQYAEAKIAHRMWVEVQTV